MSIPKYSVILCILFVVGLATPSMTEERVEKQIDRKVIKLEDALKEKNMMLVLLKFFIYLD